MQAAVVNRSPRSFPATSRRDPHLAYAEVAGGAAVRPDTAGPLLRPVSPPQRQLRVPPASREQERHRWGDTSFPSIWTVASAGPLQSESREPVEYVFERSGRDPPPEEQKREQYQERSQQRQPPPKHRSTTPEGSVSPAIRALRQRMANHQATLDRVTKEQEQQPNSQLVKRGRNLRASLRNFNARMKKLEKQLRQQRGRRQRRQPQQQSQPHQSEQQQSQQSQKNPPQSQEQQQQTGLSASVQVPALPSLREIMRSMQLMHQEVHGALMANAVPAHTLTMFSGVFRVLLELLGSLQCL